MPLLNYTTEVAPDKSVLEIQRILAKSGARKIMVEYQPDGRPAAVIFVADTEFGLREFILPANPVPVLAQLKKSGAEPRFCNPAQAERVAWRILKDWAEAQMALIETAMVSLDQVMLPYMRDDRSGQTVYEVYKDAQKALPPGPTEAAGA